MDMKEFIIKLIKKRQFHFSSAIDEGSVFKRQDHQLVRLTEIR